MSNIIAEQLLYAVIFITVLLLIEGVYLFMRSISKTRTTVDRRLREETSNVEERARVSIRRQEMGEYGPLSDVIVGLFPTVGAYLARSGSNLSPAILAGMAFIAAIIITILAQALMGVALIGAIAIGFIGGIGLPIILLSFTMAGGQKKFSEQLPIAVDLVARGLEAGHPVTVALDLVGREMDAPIGPAFQQAMEEINYGLDREVALRNVAFKYPDPNLRFFIAAVEMQRETGGNLVGVLRNLSRVIRERENMRRKAHALSAEGRLTAFLVGSLPFLVMGAISLLSPDFYSGGAEDPMFYPIMALGFIMWALGIFIIWRMVNLKV